MPYIDTEKRKEWKRKYYQEHKKEYREKAKQWRKNNREKIKKHYTNWRAKNVDKVRGWSKQWRENNPEKARNIQLLCRHGITKNQYDEMFNQQENKCKICGEKLIDPCVDHNHKTGKIRGLLCRKCNLLLGYSNENIVILKNAIIYLRNDL